MITNDYDDLIEAAAQEGKASFHQGQNRSSKSSSIKSLLQAGICSAESNIMCEEFVSLLSKKENKIFNMVIEGFRMKDIEEAHDCTKKEVEKIAHEIGEKFMEYNDNK